MTQPAPSIHHDLASRFAVVARRLASARSLPESLGLVVSLSLDAIAGAEHAGVTLLTAGEYRTLAPSSELVRQVDAIQYELKSGPCVDAIAEDTLFRTGDLAADERWPLFGKRAAAEAGVQSMLAFRLYLEDDSAIGSLNLYASERDAFGDDAVLAGQVFATHGAVAITAAQREEQVDNLEQALRTNRDIGVAMGILMARYLLDRDQAFDLLRMASQHQHRRLHEVALDVAESGTLEFPAR